MEKYNSSSSYNVKNEEYEFSTEENLEDSGLVVILDEPVPGELIDEPTPEIRDDCCCPCPPKTTAIPFVAFGPLQ